MPSKEPACCADETAECLACHAQMSFHSFCGDASNADVPGCKVTPSGDAIQSGDTVFLRSHGWKRLAVSRNGSVHATWGHQGSWQAMVIEKNGSGGIRSGDHIFLETHIGNHIGVNDTRVHAKLNYSEPSQVLGIKKVGDFDEGPLIQSGDTVFLTAHDGKSIVIQDGVVTTDAHDEEREEFIIEKDFPAKERGRFDGLWTEQSDPLRDTFLIKDNIIHFVVTMDAKLVPNGTDRFYTKLKGKTAHSHARLVNGEIHWSNGDVWIPVKGNFDGRWTNSTHPGSDTFTISGDVVRIHGAEERLTQLSRHTLVVTGTGKQATLRSKLSGDELHWKDGDVWVRSESGYFDGIWTGYQDQGGDLFAIEGDLLFFEADVESKIKPHGKTKFSTELVGERFHERAELVGGALHWSNGDVWVPWKGQTSLDTEAHDSEDADVHGPRSSAQRKLRDIPGRACFTAHTARCLACAAELPVHTFCSDPRHALVLGCGPHKLARHGAYVVLACCIGAVLIMCAVRCASSWVLCAAALLNLGGLLVLTWLGLTFAGLRFVVVVGVLISLAFCRLCMMRDWALHSVSLAVSLTQCGADAIKQLLGPGGEGWVWALGVLTVGATAGLLALALGAYAHLAAATACPTLVLVLVLAALAWVVEVAADLLYVIVCCALGEMCGVPTPLQSSWYLTGAPMALRAASFALTGGLGSICGGALWVLSAKPVQCAFERSRTSPLQGWSFKIFPSYSFVFVGLKGMSICGAAAQTPGAIWGSMCTHEALHDAVCILRMAVFYTSVLLTLALERDTGLDPVLCIGLPAAASYAATLPAARLLEAAVCTVCTVASDDTVIPSYGASSEVFAKLKAIEQEAVGSPRC